MLVDDDGDPLTTDRKLLYTSTLDSLGLPYDNVDAALDSLPGTSAYAYPYIIWFTGDDGRANILNSARVSFLRNYLDQGGRLFLTGQNIAEQLAVSADSTFLRDYLRARFVGDNTTPRKVRGKPSDPVGAGDSVWIYSGDGASNQLSADIIQVFTNANTAFSYVSTDGTNLGAAASLYASPTGFRVAFFGFGLEAINNQKTGYAKRQTVMRRVLDFLAASTTTDVNDGYTELPLPAAFDLSQNFPNPFNPTTLIRYQIDPRGTGKPFSLDVYNVLGQKVTTLASGIARVGSYTAIFEAGAEPSGVYLYRLEVGTEAVTKKMILSK